MIDKEPFKVLAVVSMNNSDAFVLNREPVLLYEEKDGLIIARDGPFISAYVYEKGTSRAFAGREFDIPMKDGSVIKAKGQYWHHILRGSVSCGWNTIEKLKKCYVFTYGSWEQEGWEKLRKEYTGELYDYWEYEKIVKND